MSHFTVLVAANNEQELKQRLQPYHEYECTGIKDQYVVFVEADEGLDADYLEHKEQYDSLKQFAEDYHGYELLDGKWGRWTNPNKKWDWWVIGGRWSGRLLSNGVYGDFGTKKTIHWEMLKAEIVESAAKRYKDFHELESKDEEIDRTHLLIETGLYHLTKDEAELLEKSTAQEYITFYCKMNPPFFAWISPDGQWHQKARMGWFAMTSDHNDRASEEFWQFIESLEPDQGLYAVDCHI